MTTTIIIIVVVAPAMRLVVVALVMTLVMVTIAVIKAPGITIIGPMIAVGTMYMTVIRNVYICVACISPAIGRALVSIIVSVSVGVGLVGQNCRGSEET